MNNVYDIRRKIKKLDQSVILSKLIIDDMVRHLNKLPNDEARKEYVCLLVVQMLKWMEKSGWFPDVMQAVKNAYTHVQKGK